MRGTRRSFMQAPAQAVALRLDDHHIRELSDELAGPAKLIQRLFSVLARKLAFVFLCRPLDEHALHATDHAER